MANTATTPVPEKEETTTSGTEAITGKKPAGESTPSDKKVVELEAQVEELTKKFQQAQTLQSQADKKARVERLERAKVERELERIKRGEISIPPEETIEETWAEKEMKLVARIGIQNLIMTNPEYLELLKQDLTLKEVIKNNPFAIIPEWIDSEDVVSQMKDYLDSRLSSLSQPKKGEPEEKTKGFEVGPIQPPESMPPEAKTPQKEALEKGDIAGSIRAKIRVEE